MVIRDPCGTGIRVKPFGEGVTYGVDATAWPGSGFKNSYVVTCLS